MILNANALHIPLADQSVHCVVTSPPYWALRDYGIEGQLGLESLPDCLGWATGAPCGHCYICHLVDVFKEIWRVLRDDGTCWLNLGDSYLNMGKNGGHSYGKNYTSAAGGYQSSRNMRKNFTGLKPKDMVGIPWRAALALQADGWYLRSDIIWSKTNPMPESVRDRPTKSHEYVFLLSKQPRYFFDQDAVREVFKTTDKHREGAECVAGWASSGDHNAIAHAVPKSHRGSKFDIRNKLPHDDVGHGPRFDNPNGRNIRSVWELATQGTPEAHFATYPEKLVEPCIKAGCPAGGIVLDPFAGSGTTGRVALRLGRRFVGTELSFSYISKIAKKRLTVQMGIGGI